MERVDVLVVGAGISGLGFANFARLVDEQLRVLVIEKESEPGGYCRSVQRAGFVWDYSGHFFHFRHPDIEAFLRARMPPGSVHTVERKSRVRVLTTSHGTVEVDFPFQTHVHQLPAEDHAACVADLQRAASSPGDRTSFKGMLEQRLGRAMCERFLVPYNEKLYACDLDTLDENAMGRFFPHVSVDDVKRAATGPAAREGYNAVFTYPEGGAVQYVHALLRDLPDGALALNERLVSIDLPRKVATTSAREIAFGTMVTSAPLPQTLRAARMEHDTSAFGSNRVLVFNLGFDGKGRDDVHWLYVPDRALCFYRVGYYDNIIARSPKRLSLYVEIGLPQHGDVDVEAVRARVLHDLHEAGIVTHQRLVASHHVIMDPAYVHITKRSLQETARTRALLAQGGVHSVGRYGGWTYCSIEDNLVEARALAKTLALRHRAVSSS